MEFYYFSIGGGSEISGVPPPSHGIFKWNSPKTMASRSNDKRRNNDIQDTTHIKIEQNKPIKQFGEKINEKPCDNVKKI